MARGLAVIRGLLLERLLGSGRPSDARSSRTRSWHICVFRDRRAEGESGGRCMITPDACRIARRRRRRTRRPRTRRGPEQPDDGARTLAAERAARIPRDRGEMVAHAVTKVSTTRRPSPGGAGRHPARRAAGARQDRPDERVRSDRHGSPDCVWLTSCGTSRASRQAIPVREYHCSRALPASAVVAYDRTGWRSSPPTCGVGWR
jgi:hypothetical protein